MVSAQKKVAKFNGDLSENSNPNFHKTASTGLGEEQKDFGGATPPLIDKPEQTQPELKVSELELDQILNSCHYKRSNMKFK